MSTPLSSEQRSTLERIVQKARLLLEDDLATTLEGRYGIHTEDGRVEEPDALSLTATGAATRTDLLDITDYLRSEGASAAEAAARLVREAAFTHLNRLIAVRVAEAIGLIPETIANGIESRGFKDLAEIAPATAGTDWERYGQFLHLCADEMATDVPALFDPRNPLLELEPSGTALSDVIGTVVEADDDVWGAPDALGWAYQFFNTGAERKDMREHSAPRNSRELAVRNQFFTPSYVVEFLVHNGLGAHLAAGIPGMAEHLPLLIKEPTERIDVDLDAVTVLDPACGSGHFLLGAYDVLEQAWSLLGVTPEEAAPHIVRSLWGVDIDPRATQIAQAAVTFRARRHNRTGDLPSPNIICARALPSGPAIDELISQLPEHVGRTVRAIADELVDAPSLGPLLKIEQRLSREVRDVFGSGQVEGTLSEATDDSATGSIEAEVLTALTAIADSATATAAHRLFAAEARDAVRFVEAMSRRYTAVLMNPPFGEPIPETKPYLKAAYPWIPTRDYNVFAAFVGRGLELSEQEIGTCGAITSRAGLFLKTFEAWREQIVLASKVEAVADLGYGIMEQALVEAAAYVLGNKKAEGTGTFVRLLKETDRPTALTAAVAAHRNGIEDARVFEIELADLNAIPGSPVAYWMSDSIRRLFKDLPPVEGNGAEVRVGLQTGDDFRFVRAFWEVNPDSIGYSSHDTTHGSRWVPFAKGGEYSPYWSDVHLVVDWKDGGEHLRSFPGSVIRNPQFYFQAGVTWPRRTNSGLGIRLLPSGTAFADKGPAALPVGSTTPVRLLGWLRSRLIQAMIDAMVAAGEEVSSGGASRSYEVGLVQKLAWLDVPPLAETVERLAARRAEEDHSDEVTRRFVSPPSVGTRLKSVIPQLEDGQILDTQVNDAAGLDAAGLEYLDEEIGPYPLTYPETVNHDDRIAELFERPVGQVIDELVSERGGSRAIANLTFVANRQIEVIAHGLEVSPRSIVRVVHERDLSLAGSREDQAFRLVSYLIGVAFGRWDVQIGRDPSSAQAPEDLLSPPACRAPGSLLDAGGNPPPQAPPGYPLSFPEDGILVDQGGHLWDVNERLRSCSVALSDTDTQLDDALAVLMKRPSLAGFLQKNFFKSHLAMYSMSRRKAPIYWQLQVPSKTWGVWLYAPRLSREMLFGIVREAEQRLRLAEKQVAHLQRETDDGSASRKASDVAKDLDREQKLTVELAAFRSEAERIANLGWEPDLDDGMVLNAAPLADLFPAWKDAARYRKELRARKHEWSTVSRFAEEL